MTALQRDAHLALTLMDLTRLDAADTAADIAALCAQANTPRGYPAAVCILPRFIGVARDALAAQGLIDHVKIATVINFPAGRDEMERVVADTRDALARGADEIDVVLPYRALMAGDDQTGMQLVETCKTLCGDRTLKVIIESGELQSPGLIRHASTVAIAAGADFIKTSTGKVAINATLEAAEVMLRAIRDSGREVGLKVAGGVRSTQDALQYLDLARHLMGETWPTPEHFRLGASGLLGNLLETLAVDTTRSLNMTDDIDTDITRRLLAVRDHAYVPYSHHPVGALIETDSGQHYAGCNVEIANYKGLCAEASAIAAMVSAGEQQIRALYVVGPGAQLCTPCGDCRQRMREFASPDTRIHVLDGQGRRLKSYSMEELLPDSFGPENVGRASSMHD